jgi:hypothetical protein
MRGKITPGGENSDYKGPEADTWLVWLRANQEASAIGVE